MATFPISPDTARRQFMADSKSILNVLTAVTSAKSTAQLKWSFLWLISHSYGGNSADIKRLQAAFHVRR